MALIPDDSKQRNALAGIVFCLVLLYFANSMWYSGAKEALVDSRGAGAGGGVRRHRPRRTMERAEPRLP